MKNSGKYITKNNLVFIICFIIVFIVLANFMYSVDFSEVGISKNETRNAVSRTAEQVNWYLTSKKNIQMCAADMIAPYVVSGRFSSDECREILRRQLRFTEGEYLDLYFADGTYIAESADISDRKTFYRAFGGETMLVFNDKDSFSIFMPVSSDGGVLGVLEGRYGTDRLFEIIRTNTGGVAAGIINSDATAVFNISGLSSDETDAVVRAMSKDEEFIAVEENGTGGSFLVPVENSDFYIYLPEITPVEADGIYGVIRKNTIGMMIKIVIIMTFIILYVKRDMAVTIKNEKRINQELKLANDRIQLNEKRYNLAMEKSNSIFFEWNILTDSLEISEHWDKILGMSPKQGNYLETVLTNSSIYPEDRATYYKFLRSAKEGDPKDECIIRMKFLDSSYSWCRINIATVLNSVNVPIRVVGVIVDIDDEKREVDEIKRQQKENHRRLQEKYAFIYRHSCDAILDINPDNGEYRCSFTNENHIMSYLPEKGLYDDAIKAFITEKVHPDDAGDVQNSITLGALEGYFKYGRKDMEIQFRTVNDDGSISWIEYRVFCLDDANGQSMVVALRDITEQKFKQEMEQLDKKRLNAAVSNIYSLIAMIDLSANEFRTIYYNSNDIVIDSKAVNPGSTISYTEFVGASAGDIVFEDDKELFMSSCKLSSVKKLHETDKSMNIECRCMGTDGKYHWIDLLLMKIDNTPDDHALMIMLVKNIDEKRLIEENLRDALGAAEDANNAKSEFLSRMSHEIRTPMNGIIGMTDIAMLSVGDDDKVRSCLGKISMSSKFLLSLINDILDMSRIENGKIVLDYSAFDLDDFIKNIQVIIGSQANSKGVDFKISEINITDKVIIGDKLRINQIIINLLSNAIKFTPEGGHVDLIIEQKQLEEANKVFMHFCVRDTGIGMSREFLSRIFKPFEQESATTSKTYGGTGLGLSISKNLVTMMGGHIQVSSVEGEGSEFDVELQFSVPEDDFHKISPASGDRVEFLGNEFTPPEEYDFSGCRVLLVEDDDLNQEIARDVFERKGAEVDSAYNGNEAVKVFSESEPFSYNAIFMDIMMPVKNGLDATKEIRELERADAKSVPIIAMSANAFKEDVAKSFAAGMDDHISKPIDPRIVYKTLKKYTDHYAGDGIGEML
ncbi:MAG: response regulator [Oscillospiraceae bacterium]|nr:response regulator [Oscillospiraceae bacterium]